MSKNPQILLNKKLNGVPVGESNDVIVEAMEDYAQSQLQELRKKVQALKVDCDVRYNLALTEVLQEIDQL